MKFNNFLILAVVVVSVSAFDLRGNEIEPVTVPEGRIANGKDAAPGQFPYHVGLSFMESYFKNFWCGGSLISSEWVLTAAHCTDGMKKVFVYLGATERDAAEIKYFASRKHFVVHPEWDPKTMKNDIALIRIPPTRFSTTIRPVKLPAIASSYSSYFGDDSIITGWGLTSDNVKDSVKTLQYAEMEIINNRICSRYYGPYVTRSNICVATKPGGGSACEGDSGGPLVLAYTKVQIGLISFGSIKGCTMGHPIVFTSITDYMDWIQEHTDIFT